MDPKTRSCLIHMLCFLEEITKWIDVGSPVDIIYLDFQIALTNATSKITTSIKNPMVLGMD